ncbi:hypothetical protein CHU92_05820 [Flavobacterium cyanobacteriorum]|uniref:TonB-dependent receptor n=1 Tax=Flavobacterium cyanobacteriorum TaxID=2022802 RepID=A0A255Z9W9_9FLAO|nr:carboxypeptidase-like regulatory domain-containing protein [Flavobacterium cyanobacteriorum]OYQ38268.1 hypothetical protein CHU92_05820 [Flavobacterium cyanobacteriorum]
MKKYFILIMLWFYLPAFSQVISGTVQDSSGVIPMAPVMLKARNNVVLQFTRTDDNGYYRIELKQPKDSLFLEVSTLSHHPQAFALKDYTFSNNSLKINVTLREKPIMLQEVVIDNAPIVRKKDTLEFNPEKFKDGSEKVIEDVLKKLPGVVVEDTGEIKYKGKPIKKMLLDGDDLFDANYVTGSRNISADMIDKVQGIENYDDNSLLKGLRDSDDTALNIVLKKGKTDFSGTATLGHGAESRYDGAVTAMMINKKIKGFGLASYNNTGQNNTPYDFMNATPSVADRRNELFKAPAVLEEGNFTSVIGDRYTRRNNNFFTSINTLHKLGSQSVFKADLSVYNDKFTRMAQDVSVITAAGETFTTRNTNDLVKRPQLLVADVSYANKEKEKFHWEYVGQLNYNRREFDENSNNNGLLQQSRVRSEHYLTINELKATYKINDRHALTGSLLYSNSHSPQRLNINPPTVINVSEGTSSDSQQSTFSKEAIVAGISYFTQFGNVLVAMFADYSRGIKELRSDLSSVLQDNQQTLYSNAMRNTTENAGFENVFSYKNERYSLVFRCGLNYTRASLKNLSDEQNLEQLFLTPKVKANYFFNKNSKATFTYALQQETPDENNLFSNIIQTNYRSFISNSPQLDLIKKHAFNLDYSYSNSFDMNQYGAGIYYTYRPANYFFETQVNRDIVVANTFYAPIGSTNFGTTLRVEEYFHPIRTTVGLTSQLNFSLYSNIVNNSELRDVRSTNFVTSLLLRKRIIKPISAEQNVSYLRNGFRSEYDSTETKNTFESFTAQTKMIIKPIKNLQAIVTGNFYAPDLSVNANYFFMDAEATYTSSNKKFTYALVGRNLTGYKTFSTVAVSDYSTTSGSHNLLERFLLVKITFGF